MSAREEARNDHFRQAMSAAVPLEIARIGGMDEEQREWLGTQVLPLMQEGGDQLLFGGKLCARTFGAYAKAVALLSFNHGGVFAFGMGWCARHPGKSFSAYPCPLCMREEIAARAAA